MSKRFTETQKWDDPWFFELKSNEKLLWIYILDRCDYAGILQVNIPMLNFCIGSNFTIEEIKNILKNRIYVFNKESFFIKKFIDYQYGVLNENNRVHNSVIELLKRKGLFKVYRQSLNRPKDKDKDKEQDKEKEKQFEEIYKKYPNKDGSKLALGHFKASVETEKDWEDINKALVNYLASRVVADGFIKNASTWFNNWRDWIDYKEVKQRGKDNRMNSRGHNVKPEDFKGGEVEL